MADLDLEAIEERDADLGNPPGGLRENYTPAAEDRRALLAEVKRLRAEREQAREAWRALNAPVPGPAPDDPVGLSTEPRPAFVRHIDEVNEARATLTRLLGGPT